MKAHYVLRKPDAEALNQLQPQTVVKLGTVMECEVTPYGSEAFHTVAIELLGKPPYTVNGVRKGDQKKPLQPGRWYEAE